MVRKRIVKKKVENYWFYFLALRKDSSKIKLEKTISKLPKENVYVLPKSMEKSEIYKIFNKYEIKYLKDEYIKKILSDKILESVCKIKKIELSNLELTILVNIPNEINLYIIENLAKQVKNIKIISLNIYKFKELEFKLYNEYGIAMQFSNSYRKSIEKSNIILNLDFDNIEINEYTINPNAIIINTTNERERY